MPIKKGAISAVFLLSIIHVCLAAPVSDNQTNGIQQQEGKAQFAYILQNGVIILAKYTGSGGAVTIPAEVNGKPITNIGKSAFADCAELTSVTIGSNVVKIESSAFSGCIHLTNITFSQSVNSIDESAFEGCTTLRTITIPKEVLLINDRTFGNCSSLTEIRFLGKCPFVHGTSVFSGDNKATVFYLPGATGWGLTFCGRPTALWSQDTQDENASINIHLTTHNSLQLDIYVRYLTLMAKHLNDINDRLLHTDNGSTLTALRDVLAAMNEPDLTKQIAALIETLRSDNAITREYSCRLLGLLGDESAVGAVLDRLQNDEELRPEAAQALGKMGDSGTSALVVALKSNNKDVAIAAVKGLGDIMPGEQRPDALITSSLIDILWRKNVDMCDAAVEALGRYPNAESVAAIIQSMRDTNIYTSQISSALALEMVGKLCLPQLLDALEKCSTTNDADFACWSAAALADIGEVAAVGTLRNIATAAWALPVNHNTERPSESKTLILPFQEQGNVFDWNWLHNSSIVILDELLTYGAWKYDGTLTPDACAQATYALARIGKPALPALVSLTTAPTAWGRCRALEALSLVNLRSDIIEPEAIVAIVTRLSDEDEYVRITARRALKSITGATTIEGVFYKSVFAAGTNQQSLPVNQLVVEYTKFVENNITQIFSFGTEKQRLTYMDGMQGKWNPYCMLEYRNRTNELANAIIHFKGIVLDSLMEDSPGVNRPETELSQGVSSGVEKKRSEGASSLLAKVARRSFTTTTSDIEKVLNDQTIVLEYVCFPHFVSGGAAETMYGVMLIGNEHLKTQMGSSSNCEWVSLGTAADLETSLKEYEALMRGFGQADASVLKRLYEKIIKPVLSQLPANVTNLIICPDAELNFLSFATLMNDQNEFLAERFNISYVASGRDLVFGKEVARSNGQLVAFANPAFKIAPGSVQKTNVAELVILSSDRRDYNGITLAALPNTSTEAAFLQNSSLAWKLNGVVYQGSKATEAQVKALHSPYILHLATHGFFLPDTTPTNQTNVPASNERLPVVLHNPMQRSGLALAGAQVTLDAWKRGEVPNTKNDGILMAEEVGLLDLRNTWLVTLSACDTGIGEVRAGEGVLGLRRGFIQAGTQNLLMTLWPISDKWTVELMEAFYKKAMQTKNAPGALASVQRDFLKRLRQEKNPVMAARLAGPFVMTFQGKPGNN